MTVPVSIWDRLRRTIVERQLSTEETVAQLSEEELLTFLFYPVSVCATPSPKYRGAVWG